MTRKAINTKPVFAKKSFGQNFLVDGNYIDKIIAALNPQIGETIVEIGSGRGALTENLIESGANVIAIELERGMNAILRERFADRENFQLVEADALKIDYSKFQTPDSKTPIKLIANLPYYISTAILQKLVEQREVFSQMILMFQREVVDRMTAQVGNSERGFLTVLTEKYLTAEKLFDVPPTAFRPSPKVNSAVVRLKPKNDAADVDPEFFRAVVSAAFVQKRKTIYNNLKNARLKKSGEVDWLVVLNAAEIEPTRRAESLWLREWEKLISAFNFDAETRAK